MATASVGMMEFYDAKEFWDWMLNRLSGGAP